MRNEIFEYIKRRKGGQTVRVGVICGSNKDGVVKIGFSKCNFKAKDQFDPDKGMQIALDRIEGLIPMPKTPDCIKKQIRGFAGRAARYFKTASRIEIPV